MDRVRGPQFLRFFNPVIEALKELGGSGRPKEIVDIVLERMHVSEAEQAQTLKNGSSRLRNQVAWARFYLAKSGWIDDSRRGVWALTERGRTEQASQSAPLEIFREVQGRFTTREEPAIPGGEDADDAPPVEFVNEPLGGQTLLEVLKSLSPAGFERISQRLLRESGFERVIVTGKSGDGGIDGHGILQVNPFVSFTVLFQCKRYSGSVSASQIRDFRDAMMGRADKGIVITTGTFTTEATKEARRDGAPPIELVDGEILVQLFERLELGVKPKTVYEVDQAFFAEYQ